MFVLIPAFVTLGQEFKPLQIGAQRGAFNQLTMLIDWNVTVHYLKTFAL